MTAMSTHLYARIESKVKSSKRIVDMSVLSEEELNEEPELQAETGNKKIN